MADKLIVAAALVVLVQARAGDIAYNVHFDLGRDPSITLAVVAAVIIGREITVSALREWMSQLGQRAHVAVNYFGKWKTTFQIIGIALMLYREPIFKLGVYAIGEVLLYLAAALTLWSMIEYLRAAWPIMRDSD